MSRDRQYLRELDITIELAFTGFEVVELSVWRGNPPDDAKLPRYRIVLKTAQLEPSIPLELVPLAKALQENVELSAENKKLRATIARFVEEKRVSGG